MEEKFEANLSIDERRKLAKEREEQEAQKQAADLFGGGMDGGVGTKSTDAGDTVKLNDLKDHLKHAHKVAQCLKGHGKIHLAAAFFQEVIKESKAVLDDDAITEIIKTCNVIKNEKVQAAKRKTSKAPVFDDEEEDLALKEKEKAEKAQKALNKSKGNALKKKKEE